jgi:hypothetical protein
MVLTIVASYHNPKVGSAWPSVETIADQANISVRRVQEHLSTLKACGELTVEHRKQQSNVYIVLPDVSQRDMTESSPDIPVTSSYITKMSSLSTSTGLGISGAETVTPTLAEFLGDDLLDLERGVIEALCALFADLLIEAGRKNAKYRSDSLKDEWLVPMAVLLREQPDPQHIENAMRWAVASDKYCWVNQPSVLRDYYPTLIGEMRIGEATDHWLRAYLHEGASETEDNPFRCLWGEDFKAWAADRAARGVPRAYLSRYRPPA